jgi:tRNA(Ile)-lysidine synthase
MTQPSRRAPWCLEAPPDAAVTPIPRDSVGCMSDTAHRDRLDPATAEVRIAVRRALRELRTRSDCPVVAVDAPVVVALSGGADSLALAAAAAFEAPALGMRATCVVVDHGLQSDSSAVAAAAARQASGLGLAARVVRVEVTDVGGPEAAARAARYDALRAAARAAGASAILLGHTLDDQAETVLLGLARGSGAASLQGMSPVSRHDDVLLVRPLLGVRRSTTHAACAARGLVPWTDPHNADPRFARVRVRQRVLPVLERELGPGVAQALARTAEQLREDADAFAAMVDETIEDIVEHAEAGIAVSVAALAANPAALRHRVIRQVVLSEFGQSLTRAQTVEVARLVTEWRGQGPIDLPGCRARRVGGRIEFVAR